MQTTSIERFDRVDCMARSRRSMGPTATTYSPKRPSSREFQLLDISNSRRVWGFFGSTPCRSDQA